MSSVTGPAYWCYQCNRTVSPSTVGGEDVTCSICQTGFLEEVEGNPGSDGPPGIGMPDPSLGDVFGAFDSGGGHRGALASDATFFRRFPGPGSRSRGYPGQQQPAAIFQVLEAMSAVLQQIQPQANQPGGGGGMPAGNEGTTDGDVGGEGGRTRIPPEGGNFNPMLVFQGQMPNFMGGGGNVEVFFDSGNGVARRLPGNFGDYFLGPGIDQLIQQLAENDPNRYGAPPASKSSVDAMPTIEIMPSVMGTDAAQCAVCKDEFEVGSKVREMPCKHVYHPDCILPWLAQHNSCPVCRYEMPTDDPDYNSNRSSRTIPLPRMAGPSPPPASDGGTSGAFSMFGNSGGRPRNEPGRETAGSTGASAGTTNTPTSQSNNAGTASTASSGGSGSSGSSRRISFNLPIWPFSGRFSSSSTNASAGQAETSSQGGGSRTTSGQTGRTDDENDGARNEARQEDLD